MSSACQTFALCGVEKSWPRRSLALAVRVWGLLEHSLGRRWEANSAGREECGRDRRVAHGDERGRVALALVIRSTNGILLSEDLRKSSALHTIGHVHGPHLAGAR